MVLTVTQDAIIDEGGQAVVRRVGAGRLWTGFVAVTQDLNAAKSAEEQAAVKEQALVEITQVVEKHAPVEFKKEFATLLRRPRKRRRGSGSMGRARSPSLSLWGKRNGSHETTG